MYRRKPHGWSKHIDFMVIDTLCLYISYLLGFWIRHPGINPYDMPLYVNMSFVILLIGILVGVFFENFQGILRRGVLTEITKTFKQAVLVMLLSSFYLFIVQDGYAYSRETLLLTIGFYFVLSTMSRISWRTFLKEWRIGEGRMSSLIIVTTHDLVERLTENIQNDNYQGFNITGIAVTDVDMVGKEIAGVPVVANLDNVVEYVCRGWVDEVFINIPSTDITGEELISKFAEMGIVVHLRLMHATELNPKRQFTERIGRYTVLTTTVNATRFRDMIIKRTVDIVSGLAGCIITGLLCIIIGPMIYIKSPGPIFFSQIRVGKNGRQFKVYKFRSMYLDAEERKQELMEQNKMSDGMMFKVDWDTRIIGSEAGPDKGLGNFIRKYSLDEWPQFLNILRGDMSLIGTRPPTLDEWEKYEMHHRARLATKPGLTGMWQVSGRSQITDFEEVVKLDMKYITDWTLGLDIKILLKTVWVVLKRDGAQ